MRAASLAQTSFSGEHRKETNMVIQKVVRVRSYTRWRFARLENVTRHLRRRPRRK